MLITWHLIYDTDTWHAITWHLIPDTWYLAPNNWHAITWYITLATWYWYTWSDADTRLDTMTPDTCITFPIHDYRLYGDLTWLLYCYQTADTPELLYSWTPLFLNPWNRETPDTLLLILYSCWSPWLDNHGYWITINTLWTLSLDNL